MVVFSIFELSYLVALRWDTALSTDRYRAGAWAYHARPTCGCGVLAVVKVRLTGLREPTVLLTTLLGGRREEGAAQRQAWSYTNDHCRRRRQCIASVLERPSITEHFLRCEQQIHELNCNKCYPATSNMLAGRSTGNSMKTTPSTLLQS